MIFSKLFNKKASWQHANSNQRIAAIKDDLQLANEQDIQILNQLASHDESDMVRRSALIKLDAFNTWFKAYQQDKNNSVKQFALENLINKFVAPSSAQFSIDEKRHFIKNDMTTSMAELALEKASESDVVIALIEKINKPQKWSNWFIRFDQPVQTYLLNQISEELILEKLAKKVKGQDIAQAVTNKLAEIAAAKQKPIKLFKDTQMTLSKLLSLKDQKHYDVMLEKRTQLSSQWELQEAEFECLAAETAAELTDKYQTINRQLDKTFAQLKEVFEQEQIAKQLAKEQSDAKIQFEQQLIQFEQVIANAVFESGTLDENKLVADIDAITEKVNASSLPKNDKVEFNKQFKQQLNKAKKIPEIAESVTKATHLISKMSQQLPPENSAQLAERGDFYHEWQNEWKVIENKVSGVLPSSIEEAKAQIELQWQSALKPLHKEQKQLFSQAQKKVGELKRLIATGKYNASFGVYKRFNNLYEQLSAHQQMRMQRDHDQLKEKMAELSDWEHYIATPRKEQLLGEVQSLATQPLDNPKEQANKVKACRKTWNSLGHADEDVDKALNDAFNEACEQAFAPCRQFYAEQEKLREQHLVTRNQIIENAKLLVVESKQESVDIKKVDSQLNKLSQQWRNAGEVDRAQYQKLYKEYQSTINPIKALIHQYHDDNAKQKQQLIEQAISQAENNNVFEAVDTVKTLQTRWKSIGFAGAKKDNQLWAEFRKANDVIFSLRDEQASKNKTLNEQRSQEVLQTLDAVKLQLSSAKSKSALVDVKNHLNDIKTEQLAQKPVLKELIAQIDALVKTVTRSLEQLAEQDKAKHWVLMFTVLNAVAAGKVSVDQLAENEHFVQLAPAKQKLLSEALAKPSSENRQAKTIEIEVLAGIGSPSEFQAQRMAIQVSLMQEKMTSGQSVDLDKAFNEWLLLGMFDQADLPLIARVKPIYLVK